MATITRMQAAVLVAAAIPGSRVQVDPVAGRHVEVFLRGAGYLRITEDGGVDKMAVTRSPGGYRQTAVDALRGQDIAPWAGILTDDDMLARVETLLTDGADVCAITAARRDDPTHTPETLAALFQRAGEVAS